MIYSLPEPLKLTLERLLGSALSEAHPIPGGDINEARLLKTETGGIFFLKTNELPESAFMFSSEAAGLEALRAAHPDAPRVPRVLGHGSSGGKGYLVMEYLAPVPQHPAFWEQFGRSMARLHQCTQSQFGWHSDNFIGSLPQKNAPADLWPEFYVSQRLQPQAEMAYNAHKLDLRDMRQLENLYRLLPDLFPTEPPALIHGDLWSGNFLSAGKRGEPVLIDPAVSFSHREMDLAMSALFGGFAPAFYQAYHEAYPLEPAWKSRLEVGQLYYLLVHVNLFGAGYTATVKRILARF